MGGGEGLQNGTGEASEVLPQQKGEGAKKSLSHAEGGSQKVMR